jgi:hypothetical protein
MVRTVEVSCRRFTTENSCRRERGERVEGERERPPEIPRDRPQTQAPGPPEVLANERLPLFRWRWPGSQRPPPNARGFGLLPQKDRLLKSPKRGEPNAGHPREESFFERSEEPTQNTRIDPGRVRKENRPDRHLFISISLPLQKKEVKEWVTFLSFWVRLRFLFSVSLRLLRRSEEGGRLGLRWLIS